MSSEKTTTPAVELSPENASIITKMLNAAKPDQQITDETKAKAKKLLKRTLIIASAVATVAIAVAVAKNATSTEDEETSQENSDETVESTEDY